MPKVIYTPKDGERHEWDFDPRKLLTPERIALEKATQMSWGDFKAAIARDNTVAWQALLWVLLKRSDGPLRLEDVSFCDEEIEVSISDSEKRETVAHYDANPSEFIDDPEAAALIEQFRAELGDSPKAKKAKK